MVRRLAYSVSEREHWISAAGGLLGILAVLWSSHFWIDGHGGVLAIASMGASAVLLFAAPHGALSQPWPVLGGHLVSALIGVTCARWLGTDPMLAASLPAVQWLAGQPIPDVLLGAGLAALIIAKHRPNIERLLQGREHRVGRSN